MDSSSLQDIMLVARESIWWLGLALVLVIGFVFRHLFKARQRRMGGNTANAEAKKLWMEVQKKRSGIKKEGLK